MSGKLFQGSQRYPHSTPPNPWLVLVIIIMSMKKQKIKKLVIIRAASVIWSGLLKVG